MKNRFFRFFFIIFFSVIQLVSIFLIAPIQPAFATTPFTSANATLSNSRLSYKGNLSATTAVSDTVFTIDSSGQADNETKNLFPKDNVCFNNPNAEDGDGCVDNTTYEVNSIVSDTIFGVTSGVATIMYNDHNVVSTQSGRITVTFVPQTSVASGGFIRVTIPAATSNATDGIPDNTGFDANALTNGNINANIAPTSFTKSGTTLTTSGNTHVMLMTLSSALTAGNTYSFIIGHASDTTLQFINPAPYGTTGTNHTRGVADTRSITLQTENSGNTVQDQTILKVAPVDGVLVSALVEMAISYTIGAVAAGTTACSIGMPTDSTATTVPFGSIVNGATFYNMAQTHTITTNATNGYSLTVAEDGAMSKDGEGVTTIPNTTCDAGTPCSDTVADAWTDASNHGLGYTLANISGGHQSFSAPNYKAFSTTQRAIMSHTEKVSGDSIYTCYRLSIDATQDAGYYFNKLTYIATPLF